MGVAWFKRKQSVALQRREHVRGWFWRMSFREIGIVDEKLAGGEREILLAVVGMMRFVRWGVGTRRRRVRRVGVARRRGFLGDCGSATLMKVVGGDTGGASA